MNINIIVSADDTIRQKVKYGFTLLLQPLRVDVKFSATFDTDRVNIFYGRHFNNDAKRIFWVRSSEQFQKCIAGRTLPDVSGIDWLDFGDKRLPRLFPVPGQDHASLDFDIVAATFMLASDFQDLISLERDEFDRFRAMDSLQVKLNILEFPVVNYYSTLLKQKLEEFSGVPIESKEYNSVGCGLALTHDIDYTSLLNHRIIRRNLFGHAILNKEGLTPNERATKLASPFLTLFGYNPPKDGLTFLRDLEKRNGIKSTFFIKTGATGREDVKYNFRSRRMRDFLNSLTDSGFEIGIHPSMKTYIDADELVREKSRLENLLAKRIYSVRQHYLKFTAAKTVGIWEKAEIKYDSTLGFSRRVGFRNSIAFPYPLYNFVEDRPSTVTEMPMILMDGTLAEDRTLTTEQAFMTMKNLIRETKEARGAAAVLFHNSLTDPIDFPGYTSIYERLLAEAKGSGFSTGTISGIIENFK